VYKTKVINAAPKMEARQAGRAKQFIFTNADSPEDRDGKKVEDDLDLDGFPPIGTKLVDGMKLVRTYDLASNKATIQTYHEDLPAYLEDVKVVSGGMTDSKSLLKDAQRATLKLRFERNPTIGDKFSSRHGQKGVVGMFYPQEDMPFSENGITPDILFNPHGFPSRMTIGMLIECIAGKAAALDGKPVSAASFRRYRGQVDLENNEDDPYLLKEGALDGDDVPAHEYFGKALEKHGFHRLGTEKLYSGILGNCMETEIFMGVIYYQRLRHMVGDKAQVRARGPDDPSTKQPVGGRSKHGGVRLGEMERDSLLAHGVSAIVRDRLNKCSDFYVDQVCRKCGYIISHDGGNKSNNTPATCPICNSACEEIAIPYVYRFLCFELAAMQIKVTLTLKKKKYIMSHCTFHARSPQKSVAKCNVASESFQLL
jgi:DNA-directed RNA polymerase I subunit RPA2